MKEIYSFIDGKDGFQYSVDADGTDFWIETNTSKSQIKDQEKYGDVIVFSTVRTRKTVVRFRNANEKILKHAWYTSKSSNEKTEREKFVRTFGAILLDLYLMAHDTTVFPPSENFYCEAEDIALQSLRELM
ncbi:hypothetical protein AVEN_188215-1 [Araneus ventricosus]|uniref:Uncharacterized protein n=1 Tax=Araneus ventricosus TaxID=182803 RepID=A0A4Y2HY70_ARAVE|nr:hypothetical protein AVEN_188215-1 [Araneus ventricosus]